MEILNDTHNLYTTGHIYDPFLAYFVFGNPFLALSVAALWEIMEYLVFSTAGNYSVFFLNEEEVEPLWDILILDLGGTVVGTLIAASLTFYFDRQFVPLTSLWKGSYKEKMIVILWFIVRAIITMPLSALGWECNTVVDLCTDSGYHLLPWGVFGILLVNGFYTWYYFGKDGKFSWLMICLLAINAPTFQRAIPASFIQIVVLGSISFLGFIISLVLYCLSSETRPQREDFNLIKNET